MKVKSTDRGMSSNGKRMIEVNGVMMYAKDHPTAIRKYLRKKAKNEKH